MGRRNRRRRPTPQQLIEAAIRKEPIYAQVVGPVCSLADREMQKLDPVLHNVLDKWTAAFEIADQEALVAADAIVDYLGAVRKAAATVAAWS